MSSPAPSRQSSAPTVHAGIRALLPGREVLPTRAMLPGLALAAAATLASVLLASTLSALSPLLVAIVLGAVIANAARLPTVLAPGLGYAAKTLLRAGVVLLGAQLALGDVLALGAGGLGLVVLVVLAGFGTALLSGRLLRVPADLTLLVGAGFSICGAAAVAGAHSAVRATREHAAAAVALVVAFGTLMIALVPLVSAALGLSPEAAGLWAGASVHEVAQVVAIGGIVGGGALETAVVAKLARVALLAPVVAVLAVTGARAVRTACAARAPSEGTSAAAPAPSAGPVARTPLVPGFLLGFLLLVAVRSLGWIPEGALTPLATVQTACLTAAMFALGTQVSVGQLRRLGLGPVLVAALTTLVVAALGLGGALLLG
ncbi:YeiH family protein [Brevibacterium album]|uniref:YeiH family protein n=1 Tax=Brevibacterium album TaxID=417948 RepID=UPI000417721D|nr:putative sulfate exporter family transporter [Brevibacterium album]